MYAKYCRLALATAIAVPVIGIAQEPSSPRTEAGVTHVTVPVRSDVRPLVSDAEALKTNSAPVDRAP